MESESFDNFAVEGFYRDVVGEFSRFKNQTLKGSCSHWLVPTPNLNSHIPEPHVPFDSRFKYKISRPRPYLPPASINVASLKEGDPLDLIVLRKEKWEKELEVLARAAKKRGKKWSDQQKYGLFTRKASKKEAEKPIYTVKCYVDVAKKIAEEPFPYFSGEYNWLSTGGCLTKSVVGGEHILLYPSGENMDSLSISSLEQQNNEFVVKNFESSVRLPLICNQRVYQIVSSHVEDKGIATVRQEKVCSVVRIKRGTQKPLVARVLLEIQEKDGAFVSIDMNPVDHCQLSTLDSDKYLKLWDLNTSSCLASIEIPTADKLPSWGVVKFSSKCNELLVANTNTVYLKDLRMPLSQSASEFSPRTIVDDCENISSLFSSFNSPLLYVGTSHHLLSLDPRLGWNQRWTHLMQAPPMYGSVFCDLQKSSEVILLSSSIPDDTVAVTNGWRQGKEMSMTLPTVLPSLGDSLLLARAGGKCLGPALCKRFEMATAGLAILCPEGSKGFSCLKATSIGDVFSQRFEPATQMYDVAEAAEKEKEVEADVEELMRWEKIHDSISSHKNPSLLCPPVCNDTIFDSIKGPSTLHKKESVLEKWHSTFPKREELETETNSTDLNELLCDLGSYKDVMAGVLLEAWDTQGLTTKPKPMEYVESWLDSCASSPHDEICTSTPNRAPSLMSSVFRGSKFEFMGDGDENEQQLFKVPLKQNLRNPTKKIKRESLGF